MPMGFLVIKEVVNSLPLTALKCSSDLVQYVGGRIWGLSMLRWAPVSIRPITGTGRWNFEGKIWSLMEGIGTVVSRDSNCWWKILGTGHCLSHQRSFVVRTQFHHWVHLVQRNRIPVHPCLESSR